MPPPFHAANLERIAFSKSKVDEHKSADRPVTFLKRAVSRVYVDFL